MQQATVAVFDIKCKDHSHKGHYMQIMYTIYTHTLSA